MTEGVKIYTLGVKMDSRYSAAKTDKGQNPVVHNLVDFYEERTLMAFKDTFVRLRKEKGWTQAQVAERIGISLAQVKKYEAGNSSPTLNILAKISNAFDVSADELVFGDANSHAANKLDAELLKRFQEVALLPERDRDAVLIVIDSLIAKQRIKEVMGS